MRANGNALHLRALSITKDVAWKCVTACVFWGYLEGLRTFGELL